MALEQSSSSLPSMASVSLQTPLQGRREPTGTDTLGNLIQPGRARLLLWFPRQVWPGHTLFVGPVFLLSSVPSQLMAGGVPSQSQGGFRARGPEEGECRGCLGSGPDHFAWPGRSHLFSRKQRWYWGLESGWADLLGSRKLGSRSAHHLLNLPLPTRSRYYF